MPKWLKKAGRALASGAGAGLATAAVSAATGHSAGVTLGLQMAAGGVVKVASKAAGREVHRIGSPLASLAVLAAANALGADVPFELAMATAGDPSAISSAIEFAVNGLLPTGIQSAAKNATSAARDYKRRGAW